MFTIIQITVKYLMKGNCVLSYSLLIY